jgi:hypothetical protein
MALPQPLPALRHAEKPTALAAERDLSVAARIVLPPVLSAPAAAPEAERRQLTVLFCDLVGSTALSTGMDPEDLRDVIASYQNRCSAAIRRYDGFVAKYMGDGILVYFGFPRAHEDEAERSVRAGLEVRRLADDAALLCRALADEIADHGEPGGDAEPHAQILSRCQSADCLDHRQAGAHRPLGIVLMRSRIAEIDQHPVAHIFSDKAVEAADRIGDGVMVVPDEVPQILRVKTRRERRRADQVAEHHRQLPPFSLGWRWCIARYRRCRSHPGAARKDERT